MQGQEELANAENEGWIQVATSGTQTISFPGQWGFFIAVSYRHVSTFDG
jgi:hypothetical protein